MTQVSNKMPSTLKFKQWILTYQLFLIRQEMTGRVSCQPGHGLLTLPLHPLTLVGHRNGWRLILWSEFCGDNLWVEAGWSSFSVGFVEFVVLRNQKWFQTDVIFEHQMNIGGIKVGKEFKWEGIYIDAWDSWWIQKAKVLKERKSHVWKGGFGWRGGNAGRLFGGGLKTMWENKNLAVAGTIEKNWIKRGRLASETG